MVTRAFDISLTISVRAEKEEELPDQKDVENLTCSLLLTPPATDTDTTWDVYSTHVRKDE
jgi:hypothetical protein